MALLTRNLRLLPQTTIFHGRISLKRLPLANGYCTKLKNTRKTDADLADAENEDVPIKFSTSQAANWKARHSFVGLDENPPPQYESLIVRVSIAVMLVYFFVLREENDIDLELGKSLTERFDEQEENKM